MWTRAQGAWGVGGSSPPLPPFTPSSPPPSPFPCRKPTRIARRFTPEGDRVRVAKRSGAVIPFPALLATRRAARPTEPGPKDTPAAVVARVTYVPPPELVPFLSAGSDLYRIRVDPAEKVPTILRRGYVTRKKDRARVKGKWARELFRARIGRAEAAAWEALGGRGAAPPPPPPPAQQQQELR